MPCGTSEDYEPRGRGAKSSPFGYLLFAPDELERAFAGWNILLSRQGEFQGLNSTVKRFSTVIARKSVSAGMTQGHL